MGTSSGSGPGGKPKSRDWAPHIWEGCDYFAWLRLLARNRFAVHPSKWYVAAIASCVTFGHTVLRYAQHGLYGRKIARTRIRESPLFIIGHWRAGTTLLHELLILDPRFAYPTTYQCFDPNHFLLTEKVVKRWFNFLLPERRPMDNMAVGWDRPQEDEFALCLMGQPSPYADVAFPNRPPVSPGALDLEGLSEGERRGWKRAFLRFLQTLTFKDPRRLVLKSPPHTARIKTILEIFPDAQFLHIVRNPYVVFPSTVNLWKSLARQHGLQRPTFEGLEEKVFETFNHLYAKLEEGKKLLDPSRFHEMKYEDLVADPLGQMWRAYEHLNLGGFADFEPRLKEYLARNAGYETNRYELPPEKRAEIARHWGEVIRRYGYE